MRGRISCIRESFALLLLQVWHTKWTFPFISCAMSTDFERDVSSPIASPLEDENGLILPYNGRALSTIN